MKNIHKILKNLFYEHDCIIIPEFGGFILNYESAYLNQKNNSFIPPRKTISFNKVIKLLSIGFIFYFILYPFIPNSGRGEDFTIALGNFTRFFIGIQVITPFLIYQNIELKKLIAIIKIYLNDIKIAK